MRIADGAVPGRQPRERANKLGSWRPMLTETPEPALAELLAAWEDFIVALRMRDGVSARAYERLRNALQACARSWEGRDSVPRLGANILVDIFPATEASADLYTGEERTRIQEVSFYLQDLVRECVGVRELG